MVNKLLKRQYSGKITKIISRFLHFGMYYCKYDHGEHLFGEGKEKNPLAILWIHELYHDSNRYAAATYEVKQYKFAFCIWKENYH